MWLCITVYLYDLTLEGLRSKVGATIGAGGGGTFIPQLFQILVFLVYILVYLLNAMSPPPTFKFVVPS